MQSFVSFLRLLLLFFYFFEHLISLFFANIICCIFYFSKDNLLYLLSFLLPHSDSQIFIVSCFTARLIKTFSDDRSQSFIEDKRTRWIDIDSGFSHRRYWILILLLPFTDTAEYLHRAMFKKKTPIYRLILEYSDDKPSIFLNVELVSQVDDRGALVLVPRVQGKRL